MNEVHFEIWFPQSLLSIIQRRIEWSWCMGPQFRACSFPYLSLMFRYVHSLQQGNRDRLASFRVQSLGSLLRAVNLDTVSPICSSLHKLVLENVKKPEIKLPTSYGSLKKQESSRKTSISALLTMPKSLTVWITINCGKFWKRWEYHTTCPASWEICMKVRNQQLELDMEQQTGTK